MANATLSPKQLAAVLASLDDAQRNVTAVRDQLIQAMAARRRASPSSHRRARFVRRKAAAGR